VNLRVSGIGPIRRPDLREMTAGDGNAERARTATRGVCFDGDAGYVDAAVYWRSNLAPGDVLAGPAIIEEYGSTVPVHPGFTARVDHFGNLLVTTTEVPA